MTAPGPGQPDPLEAFRENMQNLPAGQRRAIRAGSTAANITYWLILGPILLVAGGALLLVLLVVF